MVEEMSVMVKRIVVMFIVMGTLMGLITACDNGPPLELSSSRQPATVSGTFYTESPDDLIFPIKVLFALDCSGSMGAAGEGSDPTNQRLAAAWEFVERYNSNPNVSFEVMLWNQSVFRATTVDGRRGFTKDAGELQAVLSNVHNTGTTDYVGTIEAMETDIRHDILNTENRDGLARTKYIVIFFSDGLDNVPGETGPRTDASVRAVENLYTMATEEYGIRHFNFHTFLLPGIDMSADDRGDCIELLEDMADAGHGQSRVFENADTIDFINIIDMRLTAEYQIKFMCAYNFNVVPGVEILYTDSDGDGLSDEMELNPSEHWWRPTDPNVADTDGDGMSDYFEFKVSTIDTPRNPVERDSGCDTLPDGTYPDTDWDGLNDCEEFYKGTNAFHPDTDHDGIPDSVEFYAGTNPLEDQTTMDTDFDGAFDWYEIQRHTNVRANDPKIRSRYAYGVDLVDRGFDPDLLIGDMVANMRRYDFSISNISILDTSGSTLNGAPLLAPGDNVVKVFIAQVPEDAPDQVPVFRVADLIFNYRTATRRVLLYPADFQLLE